MNRTIVVRLWIWIALWIVIAVDALASLIEWGWLPS